ncbi:MAG TPA: hypothetical protein VHY34_12175 [Caulobacteraceae bacterium]|jgi:hypothetical protein|nr:hypothetical protein [Caulobacteraceae bacterium]
MTDDAEAAKKLREAAGRVRRAADALKGRADELDRSTMRRLLKLQAGILQEGATTLEERALAVDPAKGRA